MNDFQRDSIVALVIRTMEIRFREIEKEFRSRYMSDASDIPKTYEESMVPMFTQIDVMRDV